MQTQLNTVDERAEQNIYTVKSAKYFLVPLENCSKKIKVSLSAKILGAIIKLFKPNDLSHETWMKIESRPTPHRYDADAPRGRFYV